MIENKKDYKETLQELTNIVEHVIAFGHYEDSQLIAEQILILMMDNCGHTLDGILHKKVKAYVVEVSDEGKQSDNFIGYYSVYAVSKKQAIKFVKKYGKFVTNVVKSAEFKVIRSQKYIDYTTPKGNDIYGKPVVNLLEYDCYN